MILEKIITLANAPVKIRFSAMERSLRATGCNLPLWVIPYDDNLFDLPPNAHWWKVDEVVDWLAQNTSDKMMKKYQCFTTTNYQYVDTDIVFLRNPAEVLKDMKGFITSCGHWRSPSQTYNDESLNVLRKKTTLWEKYVFNAGQFACDVRLFTFDELKARCEQKDFIGTCLKHPYHDQTGINMLINSTDVPIYNLTLPPVNMESTFAADYYEVYGQYNEIDHWALWNRDPSRKPYLIHWAGCRMNEGNKIDELFLQYLNENEKKEFADSYEQYKKRKKQSSYKKLLIKLKKAIKILIS